MRAYSLNLTLAPVRHAEYLCLSCKDGVLLPVKHKTKTIHYYKATYTGHTGDPTGIPKAGM